jgi:hypothetical protein
MMDYTDCGTLLGGFHDIENIKEQITKLDKSGCQQINEGSRRVYL